MKNVKFLMLAISGYLLVFVESLDIQNILFETYYSITDIITDNHVMPLIYEKIIVFVSGFFIFMLFLNSLKSDR